MVSSKYILHEVITLSTLFNMKECDKIPLPFSRNLREHINQMKSFFTEA